MLGSVTVSPLSQERCVVRCVRKSCRLTCGNHIQETVLRTYFPKKGDIEPRWYVIDAEGKVLGRLSTEIARIIDYAGK